MSLTRARSPSSKNGLPDLRLLPDAPVPDGRTVLTSPDADRRAAGRGSRKASAAFHTRYQHDRSVAPPDPQDDQDPRTLPDRGGRPQTHLPLDHQRTEELETDLPLERSTAFIQNPLRRPTALTHRKSDTLAGCSARPVARDRSRAV